MIKWLCKKTYLYRYYQTGTNRLAYFAVNARSQEKADKLARKRFDELWDEGIAANAIYFRDEDTWRHQLPTPQTRSRMAA